MPDPRFPASSSTASFVLLAPVPLIVDYRGHDFRVQLKPESVSGEGRLLAVDLAPERKGSYLAYLIARPAKKAVLEAQIREGGVICQGKAGFALLGQLVGEGRARAA